MKMKDIEVFFEPGIEQDTILIRQIDYTNGTQLIELPVVQIPAFIEMLKNEAEKIKDWSPR